MQVNDSRQSLDRSSKRGMTFDAMETSERHRDRIDQLTSLVSKMNVKMDKRDALYKPRVSAKTIEKDQLIEDMIHDKDIGIEAKVEIGPEIMIVIIPEVEIDIGIGKQDQELELCQMTEGHPGHHPIQE